MTLQNLHILVIDDDQKCRHLLEAFLKTLGAKVTCCDGGESAFNIMTYQTFCCIVSDINMPGVNGVELLSKIRNILRCNTPIILTSGDSKFTQSELGYKGAQGFLAKPYLLQSLENNVFTIVVRK